MRGEAVSALDVGVRARIIDVLIQLQKDMGLAMIFISHDLAARPSGGGVPGLGVLLPLREKVAGEA